MSKKWTTTADFILNGKFQSGAPAGLVILTEGFNSVGDGAGGRWVSTGNTIAASRTPTNLGENKLSDARGNEFEFVDGQVQEYTGTKYYPGDFGGAGNGSYIVSAGSWSLVNSADAQALVQVNTFSELEALSPSEDGLTPKRYICVERANAEYLLQPSGYVALAGDVTFANGRVAALQIDGAAMIEWFGDTSSNYGAVSQIAVNSGRATKYIMSGNAIFTTTCDVYTDNIEIDTTGAYIDASALYGADVKNSPDAVFHIYGSEFGSTTLSASASELATTITVTDSSNVKVGEPIYIKSSGELWYTEGGNPIYIQMINVVKTISGNTLTLLYPLDFGFDATTYTVTVQSWDTVKNVTIKSGVCYGGNYRRNLANGVGIAFVYAEYFKTLNISATLINGFENTAIRGECGVDMFISNSSIQGHALDYNTAITEDVNSGFYGVFGNTVLNMQMSNVTGTRCRHLQDSSDGTKATISNCVAYYCHRPSFGSHAGTSKIVYNDVESYASSGGLQWRGFDLYIDGITVNCQDQSSSGVYDSAGSVSDKRSDRIIKNCDIKAERNGVKLSGTCKNVHVSGSVSGGIIGNYYPVDMSMSVAEKTFISVNAVSVAAQYSIYYSSSSSTSLGIVNIDNCILYGATSSGVRFASPASVVSAVIRDNIFEAGRTNDVNFNNAPVFASTSNNIKSSGVAATINGA